MIRDEQCKKVCRIIDNALENRPTERDFLIVAVEKAFNQLKQSKLVKQPEQKWIPCSERLPAENGNYLVTAIWKGKLEVDMDYFQFGCMWDDYRDNVIAWQELPEPYREGKK